MTGAAIHDPRPRECHNRLAQTPSPSATFPLRMPAEHGAWGILLVPYACAAALAGAASADTLVPLAWAGACALALFLLRGSLEKYQTWKAFVSPAHLALVGTFAAAAVLLVLRYGRMELFWVGAAALLLYFVQRALVKNQSESKAESAACWRS